MNFDLLKSVLELVHQFIQQNENKALYNNDLQGLYIGLMIAIKILLNQKILGG